MRNFPKCLLGHIFLKSSFDLGALKRGQTLSYSEGSQKKKRDSSLLVSGLSGGLEVHAVLAPFSLGFRPLYQKSYKLMWPRVSQPPGHFFTYESPFVWAYTTMCVPSSFHHHVCALKGLSIVRSDAFDQIRLFHDPVYVGR